MFAFSYNPDYNSADGNAIGSLDRTGKTFQGLREGLQDEDSAGGVP